MTIILGTLMALFMVAMANSTAFSNHQPGKGTTIATAKTTFSVYVKHTANLDETSLRAVVDGVAVRATFLAKGFWYEDYDTGQLSYAIEDEREGTISFTTPTLADGLHNVAVSIRGMDGVLLEDNWFFTVAEAPKITKLTPVNGSELKTLDKVSAVITDNSVVNWGTVKLTVNGSLVSHSVYESSGTVFWNGPLPNGTYNISLVAADTEGNLSRPSAWSFTIDANPPVLSDVTYVTDGMTITDGKLKFYARINDLVDIKNNVALKLNGVPVAAQFLYKGEWSYDGREYYIHSRKEAYISYGGAIAPGSYILSLSAEDKVGNAKEYQWNLTVESSASITGQAPVTYGVVNRMPSISAKFSSNAQVTSIKMKVNNTIVAHQYYAATALISYTPTEPLSDESYHTVSLKVTDSTGKVTSTAWKFYINTFPDMLDNSISNCTVCHGLYSITNSAGIYEDIHGRRLSFYGGHSALWDCNRCHYYINVEDGCQQCHGDFLNNPAQYYYAPHGSTPMIQYDLQNQASLFPVRIQKNREMWDCVLCHQPGVNITRKTGVTLGTHDIPELHKASPTDCSQCHALSLTREHARSGRVDSSRQAITCLTCHLSTDTNVQQAISNKDRTCTACHTLESTDAAHSEFHAVSYGTKCVECHGNNMMSEIQYHGSAGCSICHESTNSKVKDAIKWQKDSCFDCHSQPHGVYMSTVRGDIPLYSGVSWGTPLDAILWSDEGWLPVELNSSLARVIFSSRAAFNADTVYQYYQTEMQNAGWTLQSEDYTSGAGYFTQTYTKGRRYATVWYYTGHRPETVADQNGRITIAYY
jgi:hypothetical protein